MPEWIIWTVIGVVAAIVLAILVYFVIKFFKMQPEDRKELIIQFLIGLVTTAEALYTESGKGKEKVAWVEGQFNATAPWFLKLVLMFTKTANLNELVEKALEKAKAVQWDKNKTNIEE